MKKFLKFMLAGLTFVSVATNAEDIDLFANGLTSSASDDTKPNVLIVLDNTSNWARQNQQWPERDVDGTTVDEAQGQAEVAAIKAALGSLAADVNIALLEFTTQGNANDDGGYVRYSLQSYADASVSIDGTLDTIYAEINDPTEKRNSNTAYGDLIADAYNYLAGDSQSNAGNGTPSTLADGTAYTSQYSVFSSPLDGTDICASTYIIFISNPNASGPGSDDATNSAALAALYADVGESPDKLANYGTGDPIYMQRFTETSSSGGTIGYTYQCYETFKDCNDAINGASSENPDVMAACPTGGTCQCSNKGQETANPLGVECDYTEKKNGTRNYTNYSFEVIDTSSSVSVTASGDYDLSGEDFNLDDWTKFLHDYGVKVPYACTADDGSDTTCYYRIPVTTYTLDVFNKQPNAEHSALMDSAAEQGGGYRLEANSYDEIRRALSRIFADIIAVNTSFAAVTLPLSATNRAQAENKVFVGMFRPAQGRKPRWLGNLKHYKLGIFNGSPELVDQDGTRAINPQTGFATSCASSVWTEDTSKVAKGPSETGPYFEGLDLDPPPQSECSVDDLGTRSVWSDDPDGPFVEKGGVAQQVRNQYTGTNTSSRTIYFASGTTLDAVATGDVGTEEILAYLHGENPGYKGGDLLVEDGTGAYVTNPDLLDPEVAPYEGLRPTIHGDVVHSRPLTLSYGYDDSAKETVFRIFYGANDGLYRSVNPSTGKEEWAILAEEHKDGIKRQYENTPTIAYTGLAAAQLSAIGAKSKDYFFDGSTGIHTVYNASNQLTTGYIYPTMRRGGRMVYALDVSPTTLGTPPSAPTIMWKFGCANLNDDSGCSGDVAKIGQTWSTPVVDFVEGYGTSTSRDPVLVMGGGWDKCLDVDAAAKPSGCTKGNIIYVMNARTGAVLATFATDYPVVAEVTPIDVDADGMMDFAYAVDAGGGVYRVSFAELASKASTGVTALPNEDWYIDKVAAVASTRPEIRFLNRPEAGAFKNLVFVAMGSGDRERPLKENYPYASSVKNRFYTFIDRPFPFDVDGDGILDAVEGRDTINLDSTDDMVDAKVGLGDGETIESHWGWYFDLDDNGEQIVNPAAIAGGRVFFNSFQPEGNTDQAACADLGTARAYSLPLFIPDPDEIDDTVIVGGGIPIPPIITTVLIENPDGKLEPVTVCIGCEGFNPIEIEPDVDDTMKEAFIKESVDTL